jgi:hypothetical protein
MDHDDQPVEGATIQAELRAPNGDVFAAPPCTDKGQGRYLADHVTLPLRGAEGTWRVTVRATWGDGKQAQAERAFKSRPSLSEELQRKYGFWVEIPHSFDCGNAYLRHYSGHYDGGEGYVLIDNKCHGTISLDVHWRHADFPADEAAATAYARDLSVAVQQEHNLESNLTADLTTFQGQPTWRVIGRWKFTKDETEGYIRGGPIEWLIFQCPGSEWLWSVVVSTNNEASYMDHLRTTRETFECPASQ